MGSCVSSSHTNNSSTSNSAVKLVALISKPETTSPLNNDVITSETISCNPTIDSGLQESEDHNNDLDHKDEMVFFDTRGWLDSDCDDDFMSVAGEFTPSRGSTPVHHKFCDDQTAREEEVPSPTDNKKRLLELFKETQDEDEDEEEDYVAESKARTCLWLRTPVRSSAPATPNNNNKEKPLQLKRSHGGCVPRLVPCSSFTDRRRKMMTHTSIDVQR